MTTRKQLLERVRETRITASRVRAKTARPLPKGHPDRILEVVAPDGSLHGRVPMPSSRAIPEQVRMRLLALRKSMYRAEDALADYDQKRQNRFQFTIQETTITPWWGGQENN